MPPRPLYAISAQPFGCALIMFYLGACVSFFAPIYYPVAEAEAPAIRSFDYYALKGAKLDCIKNPAKSFTLQDFLYDAALD